MNITDIEQNGRNIRRKKVRTQTTKDRESKVFQPYVQEKCCLIFLSIFTLHFYRLNVSKASCCAYALKSWVNNAVIRVGEEYEFKLFRNVKHCNGSSIYNVGE